MSAITSSVFATLFYLLGTITQGRSLQGRAVKRSQVQLLVLAGACLQALSIYLVIHKPSGINLNFFTVGSLSSWMVILVVLLSSLRKPVSNLFIGLLPLAMMAVISSVLFTGPEDLLKIKSLGMIFHIVISVLAYSVLTVAAFQSALMSYQEHQLHRRQFGGIIKAFPPLQTMELLLFEFLWVGVILLTIALGTGFYFVQDMFAAGVIHKTVLAVLAWIMFSILLAGRHWLGWRGQTAMKLTLSGFVLLMLAYFGSKFVVDLVLTRG
ncbi:cytochrome C assembly family protein [Endozoicomonadaceae bacterium StTr2]